ncbi:MAG: tetraacyldisaccharide 4'-kinase [Nitrospira sp. LK265]|nr:tetraacyldisaccharide 4'-kinase [Nitrospira sp. LK265]
MAFLQPGQPVRKGLYWVAGLYGLIIRFRLWCYRKGWLSTTRLPCAVVSVGNLTVGGTGKTPIVILLTGWLSAKGRRVAILSRGYKRTSRVRQLLVSDGSRILAGPLEAGDEPFLMAQRCPQAVVAVGADRVALGRWVLDRYPVDCIVLDDGFQHRALHRDVDLVLLDATDAAGLDALLPAGRLREPLTELGRASAIVITRADSRQDVDAIHGRLRSISCLPEDVVEVVFRPASVISPVSGERQPVEWCQGKKTWLVSGIGNSRSFRRSAESMGVEILGETAFEDHHGYQASDIEKIRANLRANSCEIVLTTEKDGGKLVSLLLPSDAWWMLRLETKVVRGEERLHRLIDGSLQGEMEQVRSRA